MVKDYYVEFDENQEKITLPSEKVRRRKIRRNNPNSQSKKWKWIAIFGIILLVYLFYNSIILFFLSLLKANPTIYSYYLYMESEITNNTLKGLFFISIFGSIFFLVLPSEALFLYYLSSTNHFFLLILGITVLGNIFGMMFNYGFGRLIGERAIRFLFRKNFDNYQQKIQKYGGIVLLFGNILPGPIEVLAVFYGGFKFPFGRYVYLVFVGRLVKFLLLMIIFTLFWDQILYYYTNILDNILILKDLYI